MSAPALATRKLSKSFGSLAVAREIDLTLPVGARYALIGPNGAGKTTLINLMTGMLAPNGGEIMLGGDDITGLSPQARVRRGLARTFQINTLFPGLNALEAVTLAVCERRGIAHRFWRNIAEHREAIEEAYAILARLRLGDACYQPTRELPYGRQRLLEIALALATRPKVLLLDEPAAGVGTDIARQILDLIAGLGRQGVTVLLVEHNLEVVREVATSVYYLEAGSIRAHGTYEELTSDPELTASYFGTVADAPIEAGAAPVVGAGEGGAR
jgi:branched-chain amino acid transport system ATP-binding protein